MKRFLRYIGIAAVRKGVTLYELAANYDWHEYEVVRFLRCQQPPSPQMMRTIAHELGISFDYMLAILERG